MPFLTYVDHNVEKHYLIPEDRMVIFGREDHTDLQILDDSQISREHFGVERDDQGRFSLIDLGSANGTFLNGRRLESNAIRWLKQGDVVRAGRQEFTFREKAPPAAPAPSGGSMSDVLQDMRQGKGYNTIMREIVSKSVKKPGGPGVPSVPKPAAGSVPATPAAAGKTSPGSGAASLPAPKPTPGK
jgi:hypothetical protein